MAVASPERYLADLNPAQREAVLATEGPVLVIAGAGSGKTRVLTHRIAHLITACGVKPQEILAITFTNKAAGEMRERLEGILGDVAQRMWVMTFHAACGRILRREAPRLGYRSNFTIYDQADQVRLVKQCLEELDRDPKRFVPRGIHAQISNAKNQLIGPEEYKARVASFYDQTVADVYGLYQRRLHASNAVDFDDLLMLTVEVLERFPEARNTLAEGVSLRARRRVPGHESRPVPTSAAARRRASQRLRRRRSRPVDLRVPRRRHPQHPRVRAGLRRREADRARAELPVDKLGPPRGERRHLQQPRAEAQEPLERAGGGRSGSR